MSRRGLLRSAGAATAVALTAGLLADGVATARSDVAFRARAGATNLPVRPSATAVLWRARTTEPLVALTFDDGPSTTYTPGLLDVLEEEDVPATFCLVGAHAAAALPLVRRQVAGGHELVNHSRTHADLSALPAARVLAELRWTDDLLADASGQRPRLMRPPYGRVSGTVLAVAGELGYDVLLWDAQVVERNTTVARNVRHVLDVLQPGTTLLAHDYGPARRRIGMASVQPVIRAAKQRGYRFVTASQLFALGAAAEA